VWDIKKNNYRTDYVTKYEDLNAFRSISLCDNDGFIVGAHSNGNISIVNYNKNSDLELSNIIKEAHTKYITKCTLNPDKK